MLPPLAAKVTPVAKVVVMVTSGKVAPAVNSGFKLVKAPVAELELVSPPEPETVVHVKLNV